MDRTSANVRHKIHFLFRWLSTAIHCLIYWSDKLFIYSGINNWRFIARFRDHTKNQVSFILSVSASTWMCATTIIYIRIILSSRFWRDRNSVSFWRTLHLSILLWTIYGWSPQTTLLNDTLRYSAWRARTRTEPTWHAHYTARQRRPHFVSCILPLRTLVCPSGLRRCSLHPALAARTSSGLVAVKSLLPSPDGTRKWITLPLLPELALSPLVMTIVARLCHPLVVERQNPGLTPGLLSISGEPTGWSLCLEIESWKMLLFTRRVRASEMNMCQKPHRKSWHESIGVIGSTMWQWACRIVIMMVHMENVPWKNRERDLGNGEMLKSTQPNLM
jgi:hypothetical protein